MEIHPFVGNGCLHAINGNTDVVLDDTTCKALQPFAKLPMLGPGIGRSQDLRTHIPNEHRNTRTFFDGSDCGSREIERGTL